MKENETKKIKEKKLSILLLKSAIVIGCIIIFCVVMTPKDRVKDTTYSYSKLEEVKEYKIEGSHITRVRPLTEYTTFKETAEYTLNNNRDREIQTYTVKVYTDYNKTQEVTEGYIKSGMVVEWISNTDETTNETATYTISVIGDFTKDGDINITELTKIIKGVVGLNAWKFTEEEKLIADFNGDKKINVVDIEECINYIVYGKLTLENGMKLKATDEYGITWNYTYKKGEATDVHYESGKLPTTVNIPAYLDGYPVVKLYNSSLEVDMQSYSYTENIFTKSIDESNANTIIEVIIPDTVKEIGRSAFEGCGDLIHIDIPNSVTRIGSRAFYGCADLINITIPNSITEIETETFEKCSGLTSVLMSNNLTNISGGAFRQCTSLTSIEIPDGVISIENDAFWGCSNLTSIEIPDSVTNIAGSAFTLTAWYNNQPEGIIYAGKVVYKYKGKGEMPEGTVLKLKEGTKGIATNAFSSCENLKSIEIPDSVTSIGNYAFSDCSSLDNVTILEGVTNIGGNAFQNCYNLRSIKIPNNVTNIETYAFSGCTSLVSIEIPDSVTSIGEEAFHNTLWYDNQPGGVVYAGKVAYKYKGEMPENTVVKLKKGTKGIAAYAFANCTNLTNIEMPDSVISIGNDAFYYCTSLDSIMIPEGVTDIESYSFRGCSNLKSIEIPNSVVSIGNSAFKDCKSLTNITIPEGVTSIEQAAFEDCTSLESIVIWKNVGKLGYRTFEGWTNDQTINFEANEVPEGWNKNWDYKCDAKIVYGYTGN